MEKISVKTIADLNDVVIYEADEFKRHLTYFQGKRVGVISNRQYGVLLQHKVKYSWKSKRISSIDEFYAISKEITKGKQTGKSTTRRKLLITTNKKEEIAKKILAWIEKHNRYGTDISLSELIDSIGEIKNNIIAGVTALFKTHRVVQINSSHFRIDLPTHYVGETTIIGSENKKTLIDNIKKFSKQKKGLMQCNDCEKFVPKYEIHKGLCIECRKE